MHQNWIICNTTEFFLVPKINHKTANTILTGFTSPPCQSVVRQTGISRHQWGPIERAPLNSSQNSEGFQEGAQLVPHYAERWQSLDVFFGRFFPVCELNMLCWKSRIADVFFHHKINVFFKDFFIAKLKIYIFFFFSRKIKVFFYVSFYRKINVFFYVFFFSQI